MKHLAHKEGIAVGLPIDGVGQLDCVVSESMPGGGFHQGHHPSVVETAEIDPPDSVQPAEGGQGLDQRLGVGQFAVPIGPEHDQPHGYVGGGQVPKQLQAALVGPLEVVENKDHRLVFAHQGEQPDGGGKQEEPFGVRVGGLGGGQVRNPIGQSRDEAGQLGSVDSHMGEELLLGGRG